MAELTPELGQGPWGSPHSLAQKPVPHRSSGVGDAELGAFPSPCLAGGPLMSPHPTLSPDNRSPLLL